MEPLDKIKISTLLQDLSHLDRGVREQAVRSLVEIGEPAIEPLGIFLQDPYNRGRNMAARALGLIGDPRAIPALAEALKDQDEIIRSVAAWALGEIGDESAIPELLKVTRDSRQCVRNRASASLQRLGYEEERSEPITPDERIVRQQLQMLRSRPAHARNAAYRALVDMGSAAVGPLVTALSEPEAWARKAAVDALGEIGASEANEALALVADNDPDPMVRQAAQLALQKVKLTTAE